MLPDIHLLTVKGVLFNNGAVIGNQVLDVNDCLIPVVLTLVMLAEMLKLSAGLKFVGLVKTNWKLKENSGLTLSIKNPFKSISSSPAFAFHVAFTRESFKVLSSIKKEVTPEPWKPERPRKVTVGEQILKMLALLTKETDKRLSSHGHGED